MIGLRFIGIVCLLVICYYTSVKGMEDRPRIIVTTDGEADDRASFVRFLLTSNEFDVEAIVNSNSEFHWVGGKGWNAFHPVEWIAEYIGYYAQVYPNLLKHSKDYPSPDELLARWKVGNISAVGEYATRTEGARFIADILLDNSDSRPIWLQAWGGCNTIAAALKIIQEDHPERMAEVASRLRLYLIWEQDETYQQYIRPQWEPYGIPTIISDQFDCMAYIWPKVLPSEVKPYFEKAWMKTQILEGHGPLCDAYPNKQGAFNAEGDTPAFLQSFLQVCATGSRLPMEVGEDVMSGSGEMCGWILCLHRIMYILRVSGELPTAGRNVWSMQLIRQKSMSVPAISSPSGDGWTPFRMTLRHGRIGV